VSWMGSKEKKFIENLARSTGGKIVVGSTKPDGKIHAVDQVASVLKELGINSASKTLDFVPKHEWESDLKRILADLVSADLSSLLVVHPGSGASWKCWSALNFAQILDWWKSSRKPALLLEGPADGAIVKEIQNRIALPTLSNPPLPVLATLLNKCAAYIGNDSGVTHLAAAIGAKVVAIFGPTDPEIWAPRGKNVTVIKGNADCAPCSPEKRRDCEDLRCLKEITVENMKIKLNVPFAMIPDTN
jgi:heptosyltransferase-3